MPDVSVHIASKHDNLRKQLIPEVFTNGWELLAFAAGLGWSIKKKQETPARGTLEIKIPSESNRRGDTLLVDIIAALEGGQADGGREEDEPETDEARRGIKALNPDTFGDRCRELNAYAHGGFDYMESVKENSGDSYREIVMKLIAEGPDPLVVDPLAGL